MTFKAPLSEIRAALAAVGFDELIGSGAYPDLDADLVSSLLEAGAEFAEGALAPLNRLGDHAGIALVDGTPRAAPGFADAYRQFVEGGWQGLAAPTEFGGQGLPHSLLLAACESFHGANMAFGLCPMLTFSAIDCLALHGDAALQRLYLPKLVSGEWSGAMDLTEPQAGSDVGALTTRAEPDGDAFRITGQKIYITWGDHDMAPNIVHMVLARLPDAPAGSKGISLFLVPRFLLDADGAPGARNAFRCIGLEKKLGIHASPTCTMAYEGAKGWLVGQPNNGLAHMFTMMNAARVQVGVQGVGVAQAAYGKALAYAHERRQGKAIGWAGSGPSPIVAHPDVRRMLLTMKSLVWASRHICLAAGVAADRAATAESDAERARWRGREDLLTPLAKAWSTDAANVVASLGVQVHGGMGFIEETGAAQYMRDARIAAIYEGTNGIQGQDLVGRKVAGDGGAAMASLVADARAAAGPEHAELARAAEALDEATAFVLRAPRADALAGASPYLDLAGRVAAGMLMAEGLKGAADPQTAAASRSAFTFFAATTLAAAPGLLPTIRLGSAALEAPDFATAG